MQIQFGPEIIEVNAEEKDKWEALDANPSKIHLIDFLNDMVTHHTAILRDDINTRDFQKALGQETYIQCLEHVRELLQSGIKDGLTEKPR